jgi:hypothetical protein
MEESPHQKTLILLLDQGSNIKVITPSLKDVTVPTSTLFNNSNWTLDEIKKNRYVGLFFCGLLLIIGSIYEGNKFHLFYHHIALIITTASFVTLVMANDYTYSSSTSFKKWTIRLF